MTVKFDNPTENINAKIKKVKLVYSKDGKENLIFENNGMVNNYVWNKTGVLCGKYKLLSYIEYNNDNYELKSSDTLFIDIKPINSITTDPAHKSNHSTIIAKSKITEFDGVTDYPVNRVEFFVKKENESIYSPIDAPVNSNGVNPKYYWTEWNGFATGEGKYNHGFINN